jgi:NAD(P)-dependent dehydrogenase (short-subunit alcohol dehydrogenase family)
MTDIAGKSILITGGGSGLGEAMARHFTAKGARVTIGGRRADKIGAVADNIGCAAVTGDVTVAADRAAMIAAALIHGGKLDALVNNAGNMYRGPLTELDEAGLLAIFHSNVVGAMMLSGLAVPHLAKTCGSILFFGSSHTRRAFPGASPYAATKAAVQTLTQVLAAELGDRSIRVNCIVPGGVLTEINVRAGLLTEAEAGARLTAMLPLQAIDRIGQGSDVAEAAEYLITAPWVTGTILDVDGGLGLGLTRS